MTSPDPVCPPCVVAGVLRMDGHGPCNGVTLERGRPVRCNCHCQAGRPLSPLIAAYDAVPPRPMSGLG